MASSIRLVIEPDDPCLPEAMKGIAQFLQASLIFTRSGFQIVDVRDLASVLTALIEREPTDTRRPLAVSAPKLPSKYRRDAISTLL